MFKYIQFLIINTKYNIKDFEINFLKPEKNTGIVYEIKRIPIEEAEINNMLIMNQCENSIKYFGYFKEENLFYLVIELCDCSLVQIIKDKRKLNIIEIKEILKQLNNAFKIMYNNSIIHWDINPANILIKKLENNKNLYKITDYGLSKQLIQSNKASTYAGTNDYIAPEIKNNLDIDKSKVDLWSIEILIHKLYFGNTNIIQKTNNNYLDDLIKRLLIKKPFDNNKNNKNNCRISWEDYFNHDFFKNDLDEEINIKNLSINDRNKKPIEGSSFLKEEGEIKIYKYPNIFQ